MASPARRNLCADVGEGSEGSSTATTVIGALPNMRLELTPPPSGNITFVTITVGHSSAALR